MPGAGKAAEQPQPSPRAVLAEIKDDTAAAENNRAVTHAHTTRELHAQALTRTDGDTRPHTLGHSCTFHSSSVRGGQNQKQSKRLSVNK